MSRPFFSRVTFIFGDVHSCFYCCENVGSLSCFSVHFTGDELPDRLRQHGVLRPPGENGAGGGGVSECGKWSQSSLVSAFFRGLLHQGNIVHHCIVFSTLTFHLRFLDCCLFDSNLITGNKRHRHFHWQWIGVSVWYSHFSGIQLMIFIKPGQFLSVITVITLCSSRLVFLWKITLFFFTWVGVILVSTFFWPPTSRLMGVVTESAWEWYSKEGFWFCFWPVSPAGPSSLTLSPFCWLSDRAQRSPGEPSSFQNLCIPSMPQHNLPSNAAPTRITKHQVYSAWFFWDVFTISRIFSSTIKTLPAVCENLYAGSASEL